MNTTKTVEGISFRHIDYAATIESGEPCIFKDALSDSTLVQAAKQSDTAAMAYLQAHDNQRPFLFYTAPEEAKTRFFYNKEFSGFNYQTSSATLPDFIDLLESNKESSSNNSFYIGSAELVDHFPELLEQAQLSLPNEQFANYSPLVGAWIGNQTTAATHYDVSNNIAACVVGRRRFTLFPPNQIDNLYPGPLSPTPGGQVVSMFDLVEPDFDAFPKAKEAMAAGQVAELEAGDVLVYPAMWWHQVQALDDFNMLVNYWWNTVPSFVDDPMNTVLHAMLSLRDRPEAEKKAWRHVFDYYVFGDAKNAREHLPDHVLGALGQFDLSSARRHRASLLKKINR